eukprot:GHRR01034315.1.p1 GENE.GHRR01034315.1~~GHRR01034315.1.p1  ORF type:complete len:328 (+),score=147.26 GHRR01034315.1:453-1436(+)
MQVAIEQLQSELTASRKEEAVIREEAQRICDEQAAELRRAEEQLAAVEATLQQRNSQAQQLQARIREVESELENSKQEHSRFGSVYAVKERDHVRRVESLQEEVEHQQQQVATLEKLLRERTAQLSEQRDKLLSVSDDKQQADQSVKELQAKGHKLAEEKQKLEQQLSVTRDQMDELQKQLAATTGLAERRLQEKASADKEWSKRLTAKDKEGVGRLKDAEAKIKELEEKVYRLSRALADAESELSQHNLMRQRQVEEAQEAWARQAADAEAAWEKKLMSCQHSADEALLGCQGGWERRMRECEEGWRGKLHQVEHNWGELHAKSPK